jgi:hypothetical protein
VLMWLGADEEFVAQGRRVSCELGVGPFGEWRRG